MAEAIVGDWGTSRLRLFRMEGAHVAARVEGPGIGSLERTPAETLAEALDGLGGGSGPVTLCGMVGSRNGLVEVPYLDCPADRRAWRGGLVETQAGGRIIRIASGLACLNASDAPDVMRGEETKLFGLLALRPALAGGRQLVVMPGTHPKWAVLDGGRVIRFHTFFTGETFAWVSARSTLVRAGGEEGGEEAGFADGLARAAGAPGPLGALFEARAAQLRAGRSLGWARGFLSGLLIGSEVREAEALFGRFEAVTLTGGPALLPRYAQALGRTGVRADAIDGDAAVLAGLTVLADPD